MCKCVERRNGESLSFTSILIHVFLPQIVNSEIVPDNEYLEPESPIEDEPINEPIEDRKSSNEYSHVYNHLKPNIRHDVEPHICNPGNVTGRIYNATVSYEKDDQNSETTHTHNMDNGLGEGNVFEVRRSSSDTQLKVTTLNGDEESFLSKSNCDENTYFVLEKKE